MNRRYVPLALGTALLPIYATSAQADSNLIFNPSFEDHVACPQRIDALGILHEVEAWWQPTLGSSDYFHLCGQRECSVPRNKMGYQQPHTGNAYCGIYCSQHDYREYLQTELRTPLVAGATYRVSLYVSLADKSPCAIGTLGVLISPEAVTDSTWGVLMQREVSEKSNNLQQTISIPYHPQIQNPSSVPLADTRQWTILQGTFVAKGGERFLTIGNFADYNHSGVVENHLPNTILPGAYYYIDDVSLVCLTPNANHADSMAIVATNTPSSTAQITADTMQVYSTLSGKREWLLPDTLYTLKNLFFEVDKSELLPQSYRTLRMLVEHMEANPNYCIEIMGHTDSTGTIHHNQMLSEARAKAVAEYLVSHGIAQQRVRWVGYGEQYPAATNATVEGRRQNRRVEASFHKHCN